MRKKIWTLSITLLLAVALLPLNLAAKADTLPYSIGVDLTNQIVTIYSTLDGSIVRQMLSSTGLNNSTPKGTYTLPKKERAQERTEWYFFRSYNCYAHYATRIYKGIMFHSIPCNRKSDSSISKKAVQQFGKPASHGCIRLRADDAEFIARNCLEGTTVKIYESKDPDEDLRALLMESSYTGENGMTYSAFLGIPDEEGVLGRYSAGNDVKDLQYRLRALGFYSDDVTGEYRISTVNAVKQVQRALGQDETGYTTQALSDIIFSAEAPTAMNVDLTEGMSGPVVRNLQDNLTVLRLYDGEMDGIYDGEVIEAVRQFQQVYGYNMDGVCTSEIQQAIAYECDQLRSCFGDSAYEGTFVTEELPIAVISTSARVRLRSEPTTDSSALDSLSDGTSVVVLEDGGKWSKVQVSGATGYVKSSFLKASDQSVAHMEYTDGTLVTAVGCTIADLMAGAPMPSAEFAEHLASLSAQQETVQEGDYQYATVNTGAEGTMLNLRETPSSEGNVLAQLANGEKMEVLLKSTVWSYVDYQGQNGYLMNNYLDYWSGPEDALSGSGGEPEDESETDSFFNDDYEETLYALVLAKAPVYDLDSEDANLLGHLAKGIQVKLVESDDEWSRIEYNGHQGYMHNADLQFILTED